jgi:hypothetical protein
MGENTQLELLRIVGYALYGDRWQSPIAADLGVSDRAVRYWLSQASKCPDDLEARLLVVITQKQDALRDLEMTVMERLQPHAQGAS